MAYGFVVHSSTGDEIMSTEDFGLQIVDDFTISGGASGSKAYPQLDYFTTMYAVATPEYDVSDLTGSYPWRAVGSHTTANLSVSVGGGNIPTLNWSPAQQKKQHGSYEPVGGYYCYGVGCELSNSFDLPSIRITVMAA